MEPEVLEFREKYRRESIPKYYLGLVHLAFTATVLLGMAAYCVGKIENMLWYEALIIPAIYLFGGLTVFVVHKYLLHRRQWWAPWAFKIHTLQHHQFYTYDSPTPESTRDFHILLFPPFVIGGFALFFVIPTVWLLLQISAPNVAYLVGFMSSLYFALYEIFHFVSHVRDDSWVLRLPLTRIVREHHRIHHHKALMGQYNFDIVFPIFDYVFRTVYKGDPSQWQNQKP